MEHLIKISDVCQARFSIEAITGRKKEGGREEHARGIFVLWERTAVTLTQGKREEK